MRALVVSLALSGCVARTPVDGHEVAKLHGGGLRDAVVLKSVGGPSARLAPGSEIRFCRADGACTPWMEGDNLRVDERGVYFDGGSGWAWEDIARAEVDHISGVGTLGALAATGAIVAVIAGVAIGVALVSGAFLPKDEPPKPRSDSGNGDGIAKALLGAIWEPPEQEPGTWKPAIRPEGETKKAFQLGAERRGIVRLLVAADVLGTRDLTHVETFTFGLRLGDMLEVGGVTRHVGDGQYTTLQTIGGYVGGHFSIDAGDRVAIPFGIDATWGDGVADHVRFHGRVRWGLRVRFAEYLFVGAYPGNPTRMAGEWRYPSGLELGGAF